MFCFLCGSRCLLQAPSPPWHCCCRSACKVHVSHLQVPCVWRRIEVRCYPLLPKPVTTLLLPTCLNRARLPFTTGISTTSFSYCTALELPNLDLLSIGHCFSTTVCRASPRHELRLWYVVSFRDVWHLSLYCMSISFNCTWVVSTAFWRCRLHRWSVHPLQRIAGT